MASGEWVVSDVSTGATLGQPSNRSAGPHTATLWGVDQHGARALVRTWQVLITDRKAFRVIKKDYYVASMTTTTGRQPGDAAIFQEGDAGRPNGGGGDGCDTTTVTRDPEARARSGVPFAAKDFIRSHQLDDRGGRARPGLRLHSWASRGLAPGTNQEQMCDHVGCVGVTTRTFHWARVRRGQHTQLCSRSCTTVTGLAKLHPGTTRAVSP